MLGLKSGTVSLCEHCEEWEYEANTIICQLKEILGEYAIDIQHIGSTSIKTIKAKPVIDIVIGVKCFERLDSYIASLSEIGVYKSSGQPFSDIILFSKDDEKGKNRLFNIQVVLFGEEHWNKHILFRDYMNTHTDKAVEYERIKICAASTFPTDVSAYSNYKNDFICDCIEKAKKQM